MLMEHLLYLAFFSLFVQVALKESASYTYHINTDTELLHCFIYNICFVKLTTSINTITFLSNRS